MPHVQVAKLLIADQLKVSSNRYTHDQYKDFLVSKFCMKVIIKL